MRKYFLALPTICSFATNALADCALPPAGIHDMNGNSFYIDAHHSVVDPLLEQKSKAAAKPFDDFLKSVSANADLYVINGDKAAAACGLQWLDRWAQDDAMLGNISSNQAQYQRKLTLAGLSLAYLKLKPEVVDKELIESWLSKVADASLAFAQRGKMARNNHYYWVGLAVMATGVATGNTHYIDEARKIYILALSDIQEDGSLPQELNRASRALTYHNYALAPLVMMAELAKSKNENWYQLQNSRLDKLARLVLTGLADSSWFQAKTGETQEIPRGGILGWVEFYHNQKPELNAQLQSVLAQAPFYDAQLGGNLTALAARHFFELTSK